MDNMTTATAATYYVLCQCGNQSSELMHDGQVKIYTRRRAAQADMAHMRLLMEGGPRTKYSVRKAQ